MMTKIMANNINNFETLTHSDQQVLMKKTAAYYDYLLEKNPRDARADNELGKISFFQGRNAEALAHFRSAMASQPDYDEPHYFLGLMARRQSRSSEAKTEFETALRLNPENF